MTSGGFRDVRMRVDLHERLHALRRRVSEEVFITEGRIGAGTMVGILLDHWEEHPEAIRRDWLEEKLASYPTRGRPRGSPSHRKLGRDSGHRLVSPEASPVVTESGRRNMQVCMDCGWTFRIIEDGELPYQPCPLRFPELTEAEAKPPTDEWLKKLLFSDEEIARLRG